MWRKQYVTAMAKRENATMAAYRGINLLVVKREEREERERHAVKQEIDNRTCQPTSYASF